MFDLHKFDFSAEEIHRAAAENRLLSMEIEFSRACNYHCPYCYAADENPQMPELSSDKLDSAIFQASELGARKIVILGGEPLLYDRLEEKIHLITSLGMGAEIFTNGSLVTPPAAEMLFRYGCRVVVKFNSLKPEIQDSMTGEKGALPAVLKAIKTLQKAGYTIPGMLAGASVICSENIGGMLDLWKYMRENTIQPYFEMLTPQGRLLKNKHLLVPKQQVKDLFDKIAELDQAFGHQWTPQPPLVGGKCFRHTYSCVVNACGEVKPCVGVDIVIGRLEEKPLREILAQSQVICDLKNHRKTIKGACRTCEKADSCYGCRGAAYQVTGDYLASDPFCWNNPDGCDPVS